MGLLSAPRWAALALAYLLLTGCKAPQSPAAVAPKPAALDPRPEAASPNDPRTQALYDDARQVLESRCVVCHGCYDAPCQLKLDEPGGVFRGGTKTAVYDSSRLTAVTPTRYGIDAQSIDEWRSLGFHQVIETDATGTAEPHSTLLRMLALKESHPLPEGKLLPKSMPTGLDRDAICATPEEMDSYEADHPLWGMPYALPGLATDERQAVERWLADGSPLPQHLTHEGPEARAAVERWEDFFNQPGAKARLVARYLYEHLFLATLLLDTGNAEPTAYRLVRSLTPPGEPIAEIATRRSFDAPPKPEFYYRLRLRTATRLSKTHMPYVLDADRLARWQELFFEPDYEVETLPGYETEQAANPFVTFEAIPVRSRYAFLLDEAEFTLMGFIKGPVCRGQVALDVIQDHFWVTFVSPDAPLVEAEDAFLKAHADHLNLPAGDGSNAMLSNWFRYARHQRHYLEAKARFLREMAETMKPNLELVWDGNGTNPNAGLTVFRHFDSASVVKGLVGPRPKTAWLLSYAVLERIHYLLVAGFDVFGNVGHQLNTRLYMDFLRMEAEHNFLLLLPREERFRQVDAWYQGVSDRVKNEVYGRVGSFAGETAITYDTDNPKGELLDRFQLHLQGALAHQRPSVTSLEDPALREPLEHLAAAGPATATQFPELAFLSVRDAQRGDRHFTVLRTSAHTNVAHLFREDARRVPEGDSLVVLPGFLGAYPNAFFVVARDGLSALAQQATTITDGQGYEAFVDAFGVRRTDPSFWEHSDYLRAERRTLRGPASGLLDYNRLENR